MCSFDQNSCQKLHPSAPHPEPSALNASFPYTIIYYVYHRILLCAILRSTIMQYIVLELSFQYIML